MKAGLTAVGIPAGGFVIGVAIIAGGATGQDTSSAAVLSVAQLAAQTCTVSGPAAGLNPGQAANADLIVSAAMTATDENTRAAQIAVMTAMTESGLREPRPRGPGLARAVPAAPLPGMGDPSADHGPYLRHRRVRQTAHARFPAGRPCRHGWRRRPSSTPPMPMAPTTNPTGGPPAASSPQYWPTGTSRAPAGKEDGGLAGPAAAHGLPAGYQIPAGTPAEHRAVVAYALAQLGKPYVWGAAGPGSFDCSGLTMAAWATVGVALLHYTGDQQHEGVAVTAASLTPGDLVLTPGSDPPGPGVAGHVGIFIGDGLVDLGHRPAAGRRRPVVVDLRLRRPDRPQRPRPRRMTTASHVRKEPNHATHLLRVNISPNSNGLPGIPELQNIVGALLTIGLVASLAGLAISAMVWAVGNHSVNPVLAGRGKTGVLVVVRRRRPDAEGRSP